MSLCERQVLVDDYVVSLLTEEFLKVKYIFDNGDLAVSGQRNQVIGREYCRYATESEKNFYLSLGRREMLDSLKSGDFVVALCSGMQSPRLFQLFSSWSDEVSWRTVDERSKTCTGMVCYILTPGSIIRLATEEELASGCVSEARRESDLGVTEHARIFMLYS